MTVSMAPTASTSKAALDERPNKIAKLTIASSVTGALLTAAYEATRGRSRALRERQAAAAPSPGQAAPNLRPNGVNPYRHPTALLSATAALNSGVVGLLFFSLREYVISPALVDARNEEGGGGSGEGATLTWSAKRLYHVPDTAITSALLGGAFNAWKRGLVGIPSGAFTAALACTTLQFLANELDVQRIRFVSARQARVSPPSHPRSQSSSEPSSMASGVRADSTPASTSVEAGSAGAVEQTEPAPSFGERFLGFIGITKVSDEEYLRRLKARRELHLARIRELEEEQQRSEDIGKEQ